MMLFAQNDAAEIAGQIAIYVAIGGALVTVIGAIFGGLGALLKSWYDNRGKVRADEHLAKADALLEYKGLYDASRSEVHTIRNEFNQAHLAWQVQAEQDRKETQRKMDEARSERQTQVAVLTAEVFKLHDDHTKCIKEAGTLRGEVRALQLQINTLQARAGMVEVPESAEAKDGSPTVPGDLVKVVVEGEVPPGGHRAP